MAKTFTQRASLREARTGAAREVVLGQFLLGEFVLGEFVLGELVVKEVVLGEVVPHTVSQRLVVQRSIVQRSVVQRSVVQRSVVERTVGQRPVVQRPVVLRRNGPRKSAWCLAALCISLVSAACGSEAALKRSAAQVDSVVAVANASTVISPDTAGRTLASAAGAKAYHVDDVAGAHGTISGSVHRLGTLPVDTMVVPDRDSTGCRAFQDVTMPVARGARSARNDSSEHDVGNAIVWLVGVTHGPRDVLPRRVNLVLDGCHLEPRVMAAPAGATINMTNRDDMLSKLHFVDHGRGAAPRATIGFTDPGQVVPSQMPLGRPGLVEITDEKHPWVRGFIAVAPHPFVAVTAADGRFLFEGVPVGEYALVAWHERLGARVMQVRVEARGTAPVLVVY